MPEKLVEYLTTTRMGERGTMTLPKEYRDALSLESGAALTLLRVGDGLILIPEQERFARLCDSIASRLEGAGISEGALEATLPDIREQVARERYPKLFRAQKTKPSGKRK